MWHLYEVIIGSSRLWLKVQASCTTTEQARTFFGCRFTGINEFVDDQISVTPFRLSQRTHFIANWAAIADELPAGWDDEEFQIEGSPYPWCKTLSDNCECHGSKGTLDEIICSDFGLQHETDKRASKSENVRHQRHIRTMEETIVQRDESRKQEKRQREQRSPRPDVVLSGPNLNREDGEHRGETALSAAAIKVVNDLIVKGFYCSVHGSHHAYDEQAIRSTLSNLAAVSTQISIRAGAESSLAMSNIRAIATHWLQLYQSEACAHKSLWADAEIPEILYKYIPRERIGSGAPDSLRATQLLALNDDMECNVTASLGHDHEDTLTFLAVVQTRLEQHLGIEVPWDELLTRWLRYMDPRLSTFIQQYLNPLVGVVSFSSDILVPTMWAHYARNTGIVVGYDTEALRTLGFELRPVVYSELAPSYQPQESDFIRLDFVNRELMEREFRAGRNQEGFWILTSTDLAKFGADWKNLSRLLLVKGISWAYEKEVRLLVDLEHTRKIGKQDENGWPIKVIDPPPEAIREIHRTEKTRDTDVERAVQIARGKNKKGLLVGHISSHAFRMQKTVGTKY